MWRLQEHSSRLQMFSRPVKTLAWAAVRQRRVRRIILTPGISCHHSDHQLTITVTWGALQSGVRGSM